MKFSKMHGLGNDFVLINGLEENITKNYNELAKEICDRNFGVGADGLMIVFPSEIADIKMRIFNSDGSEPEMCGNGIRCFAKFVYEEALVLKKEMAIETKAGIIRPELILDEEDKVSSVIVDMGEPILENKEIPFLSENKRSLKEEIEVSGEKILVTPVSMGNPHCIIFVDRLEDYPLEKWGPLLENHERFPEKTNVEFAKVLDKKTIQMKVWERGTGITLACGTGACATLVAGVLNAYSEKKGTIKLPGGDLAIEWKDNNRIYMTGAVEEVFKGRYLKK